MNSYVQCYIGICDLLNRKLGVVEKLSNVDMNEDCHYDLPGFLILLKKINLNDRNATNKFCKRVNLHMFRFYFGKKGKTDSTIKSVINYYESDKEFSSHMLELVNKFYQSLILVNKLNNITEVTNVEHANNTNKLIKYSKITMELQSCILDTTLTLAEKARKLKTILVQVESIEEMLTYLGDTFKEIFSIDMNLGISEVTDESSLTIKTFLKNLRKASTYDEVQFREVISLVEEIKKRIKPTNSYNTFLYDTEFIKNVALFSETIKIGISSDMKYINDELKPEFNLYLKELICMAKKTNMLGGLENLQSILDRFIVGKFVNVNNMLESLTSTTINIPDVRIKYYTHVLNQLTQDVPIKTMFYNEELPSNPIYTLVIKFLEKIRDNLASKNIDWSTEYITETYNLWSNLSSK